MYKLEHNTTFREVKVAVHAESQVSKKTTAENEYRPKNTINNLPPLAAEEFLLLNSLESTSDNTVGVAFAATGFQKQ